MRLAPLAFALLATLVTAPVATAAEPITLTQAMADPDWIGPPVDSGWWRWDGKAAQYLLKRNGATIRDTWQVGIDGGAPARLDGSARADLDTADAAMDVSGTRSAFVRNGDVFVRDLRSGALAQLTRSGGDAGRLQWSRDGALTWRSGAAWQRWDGRVITQAAVPKAEDAPTTAPKPDDLRDRQLRLIATLKDDRARRDAVRDQAEAWRSSDPSRAPAPIYLGKDVDIVDSALSPDGAWLLVATTVKGADAGATGKMPKYVTESGYEEFEDVRTRVGRGDPLPQALWLAEVATGNVRELKFDALPGIATDPLAALRKAAGKDALKGNRAVQVATGGDAVKLTDTRSAEFKARTWLAPQTVRVPSKHGAGEVWAKLYRPATLEAGRKYPVVMFVHGAGYLQNVSDRYPAYFREQMFHQLLVERGFIVLDMDFRASEGYGRDWRTAIYRQMGHPELEDYLDGIEYMVAEHQGDRAKVGIYGGSYGGFMSFMALFRAPEAFVAGAALRPVTDWTSYNHEYTSNILNTPELDPEAYAKSSPIEYAQNLRGHLLISHGMIDDNVLYQDSVRLAQRLIELKKDHWEMASYPLERHAYQHPESWYDQYRRILQLFERTLK